MAFSLSCWSAWAPRAVRQSRSAPLLYLFDGYRKCSPLASSPRWRNPANGNAFSTSPFLAVKRGKGKSVAPSKDKKQSTPKPAPPAPAKSKEREPPSNDSRLQPPTTVASHTEGAPSSLSQEPLTWRDYDLEGGMPLPNGERTQAEINAIFGGEQLDVDTGNYILSVMHWRRLSGALIDAGLDFPKDSGVERGQALAGLEYIRQLVPDVDEAAEGARYAEEEVVREQQRIQARAVKLGIYKANPEDAAEEEVYGEEESKQGTEYGRERSGQSALQKMREEKEAAWEEQQAADAVAAAKAEKAAVDTTRGPLELSGGVQPTAKHLVRTTGPNGVSIQPPRAKAWLQPVERKPWVKHYEDAAQIIKTQEVPNLSTAQRLVPSFMLLLVILSACYYLHENYTPPPKSARVWPDTPPSAATLWALTGVLLATFIMGRIPPLWRTYSKYMCVVPAYPYALSLFGSGFRHDTVMHLGSNLLSLWIFGLILHEEVGRGTFLSIYFASGALGGFTSLAFNVYRKLWMSYIFGASGAVFGVVAAVCTLQPNGSVKVFGWEIPVAAWVFLALQVGGQVVAVRRGVSNIDQAGHLGGMLGGFASAIWLRIMMKREREANLMVREDENKDVKALEVVEDNDVVE
ncbi:uncharacterized protein RCC_02724 [Ramularia collo-cygni]|uniref:Peptidase S54 rhomboid domain-containing protein n=1 Tax=Ramularia collo-cygni TaxID=112498 RepID=A0A2D3V5Y3_9PEZI|nr:uncharacterized protein RCC_02724 [Ramularia collo-cygni]CZT16889.1 uncharacterized protein RCC_02724 [Ramularia collo-cygni]